MNNRILPEPMATDDKLRHTNKNENVVDTRQSPPKAIVDYSPLQPAINKNKEALKIKLMVRRPITQLVDQGIIPSLKSSPALHEQRKQLERAKTGDILKAKIQQRPDRQELERRHILEHDESHVDPSLAERQRMLKKARLADQLNSQLSHRPGPLELIKKNILHTEEPIERIVKEGLISFKATSEGLLNRPQQPNGYITFEDDSQSSEGDQQNSPAGQDAIETVPAPPAAAIEAHDFVIPMTTNESNNNNTVLATVVAPTKLPPSYYTAVAPIIKPLDTLQVKPETSNLFAELCKSVIDNSNALNFPAPATKSNVARVSSLPLTSSSSIQALQSPLQNSNKCDAPGKDKIRKKNKLKPITKTRTIKFHEYKGPPNAQKNGSSSVSSEETSYQLLLKQQNCLLEYLEGLHKNPSPTTNAKAPQSETSTFSVSNNYLQQAMPSPATSNASITIPSSPVSNISDTNNLELSKLEKMKVSDLKLLLKTRNLPVSGPKPQLIERLRPFMQSDTSIEMANTNENSSIADEDNLSRQSPASNDPDNVEMQELPKQNCIVKPSMSNEELLREQQRKIDELQRKLKESQQELQQMQMKQSQPVGKAMPKEIIQIKPEVLNQKQIFKQQLEAKIQKEKLQKLEHQQKLQLEQQQQLEMQRKKQENQIKVSEAFAAKPKANFIGTNAKNPNEFVWNGESTFLLVNIPDDKKYLLSNNSQTSTMPNILVPISATPQNMNAIMKKVNLNAHTQQAMPIPPPPPPINFLTQLSSPKVSSHSMNIDANNVSNKFANDRINLGVSAQSIANSNQNIVEPLQRLPSINNVMLNNVTTTIPFSLSKPVKKEFPMFGSMQSTDASTSNFSIPSDLMLNSNAMDTMSPMQQSNCDDSCNSFDLFLSEAAQSHSDTHKSHESKDTPMDIVVKKEPSTLQQTMNGPTTSDNCNVDLKSFDDLELMELMGQQLDMDISDDSCHPMNNIKNELNSLNSMGSHVPCRRDMNPSLQPSLSELIQQQQMHHQQQQQQPQQQQQNQSQQEMPEVMTTMLTNSSSSNNDTNNNLNNSLDSNTNNNLIDYNNPFYIGNHSNQLSSGGLHLGSMDIEYFDSALAQFDFALTPPSSTPSVPITTSHQNNIAPATSHLNTTNLCFNDASDHQQANLLANSLNTSDFYQSNTTNGPNHINNVLDLFNIEWNEVDYAV